MAKRKAKTKRGHLWGGAGYVCADCGAIKDTSTDTGACPGPSDFGKTRALINSMEPKPNLPRGLWEFEASLDDIDTASRLLPRLLDLPESGLHSRLNDFLSLLEEAAQAEAAARIYRNRARDAAKKVWEYAKAAWSIEELQKATGYDQP